MKYSVLVKRIVNVRIDNVDAESQAESIERIQDFAYHQVIRDIPGFSVGLNGDGTSMTVRYVDDGDQTNCYLVDEEGDEEFERSKWYGSDGITVLEEQHQCAECMRKKG